MRRYVDKGSTKLRTGTLGVLAKALDRAAAEPLKWNRKQEAHSWLIRYAGNCSNPVTVFRDGVPLSKAPKSVHEWSVGQTNRANMLEIEVPCRLCENCLRRRAAHWRLRAQSEYAASVRTWFGTLTLSADQHYRVLLACRAKALSNGDDFDKFPQREQFAARHACISREITLYLKRVREAVGSPESVRFVCVVEAHKTGLPHYHMLVHESSVPVKHAVLSEKWRVGFSSWKLVKDKRAAGYVTKYLAKSSLARVRASSAYGQSTSLDIALPRERETKTPPPALLFTNNDEGRTDLTGGTARAT